MEIKWIICKYFVSCDFWGDIASCVLYDTFYRPEAGSMMRGNISGLLTPFPLAQTKTVPG